MPSGLRSLPQLHATDKTCNNSLQENLATSKKNWNWSPPLPQESACPTASAVSRSCMRLTKPTTKGQTKLEVEDHTKQPLLTVRQPLDPMPHLFRP